MRAPSQTLILVLGVLGCSRTDFTAPLRELPPDDPGVPVAAATVGGWPLAWRSGRLIVTAYTGRFIGEAPVHPLSFALLSVDPASRASDTIATQKDGGGLAGLAVADATGDLYFSYRTDISTRVTIRHMSASNVTATLSTSAETHGGDLLVSPDNKRLIARSSYSPSQFVVINPANGLVMQTLANMNPTAVSPDGSEVFDRHARRVIRLSDGSERMLSIPGSATGSHEILDARWKNGGLSLLLSQFVTYGGYNLVEWKEGSDGLDTLGNIKGLFYGATCGRFLPKERSAVVIFDDIGENLFTKESKFQASITVLEGGTARKIGSINHAGDQITSCTASPDGAWFAFRRMPDAVFVRPTG